jgi:eukaryotic-like serine/threonine-protein kinase
LRPERLLCAVLAALLVVSGSAFASSGFQGSATHDGNVADAAPQPPLKRAWHRDLGASPGFPIVAGGRVFVIAGGTLYALDRATGRTLWRRAVAAAAYDLAYDGGLLFVVTGGQHAQALDPVTGAARWTVRITDPTMFAGQPVAAGGRLYTIDDGFGSYLSAFDGASGTRAFRVSATDASNVPAVDADRIYLGSGRVEYGQAVADGKRL